MPQTLNIANFICKFGDEIVLLDKLEEIIIPAFLSDGVREYGEDIRYFLHNVQVLKFSDGNPEVAISGRLVKEGKVTRDQVFHQGKIVKDHREMESAPSSFFVLLLSNHKLLYVRETIGAPALSTFASTMNAFIKNSYRDWLKKEMTRSKEAGNPLTQRQIVKRVPLPNVEIVELSTESEIRKFVRRFKIINAVEIQLLSTNHETDNAPLFRRLRGVKDKLGAEQLTIKNTKSGDVGLNKADVADFVSGQAEEANSRIVLRGKDLDGEPMNAVNDHFKLSIKIPDLPQGVLAATNKLYKIFERQITNGTLVIKKAPVAALRKLENFRNKKG